MEGAIPPKDASRLLKANIEFLPKRKSLSISSSSRWKRDPSHGCVALTHNASVPNFNRYSSHCFGNRFRMADRILKENNQFSFTFLHVAQRAKHMREPHLPRIGEGGRLRHLLPVQELPVQRSFDLDSFFVPKRHSRKCPPRLSSHENVKGNVTKMSIIDVVLPGMTWTCPSASCRLMTSPAKTW